MGAPRKREYNNRRFTEAYSSIGEHSDKISSYFGKILVLYMTNDHPITVKCNDIDFDTANLFAN